MAGACHRLSLRGGRHPHDPIDAAGGPAGGLCPDRPGQGAGRASHHQPARITERPSAGDHDHRYRVRFPDGGPRRHRAGLQSERHRQAARPVGLAERLHDDAGAGHARRDRLRVEQFRRRSGLRLARSAHSLPLRGVPMATTSEIRVEAAFEEFERPRWRVSGIWQFARRQPLGAAGGIIVIIMILAALFADVLAPYVPVANDFMARSEAPSWTHPLGTDQFGRDLLSRIIYGARTALFVGFVAAFVGGTAGLILGVTSAYFGGLFDLVFQRVMDVFMAFPLVIMALAVVAILGKGTENVI